MDISWIEWLGYASSILVAISLLMSSLVKLRIYNLLGSILFSIYGFSIGAYPVGIINLFIVLINIYYLYTMSNQHEFFKLMNISKDDQYIDYFLEFYRQDIKKYFPKIDLGSITSNKDCIVYYILRNTVPAGVFAGYRWKNNYFMILLDYVTPEYRDFKIGNFIFANNKKYFTDNGYEYFCATLPDSTKHIQYLKKMGFKEENIDGKTYLIRKC